MPREVRTVKKIEASQWILSKRKFQCVQTIVRKKEEIFGRKEKEISPEKLLKEEEKICSKGKKGKISLDDKIRSGDGHIFRDG